MNDWFRKLRQDDIIKAAVTLFIGALMGQVLNAITVPEITVPVTVFIGVVTVLFFLVFLVILALRNDTKKLIERSGVSFQVVQEEVAGDGSVSGRVYSRLAELAANAEREILVFNYPREHRVRSLDTNDQKIALSRQRRIQWLDAELGALQRHQHGRFKYVMIIQAPDETTAVTDMIDRDVARSLQEMLILKRNSRSRDFTVDIRRSNTEFVNPFMLVDERFLTIPMYSINQGNMYIDKILVFEDREGQLIANFKTYFEQMERKATGLTQDNFVTTRE